MDEQTQDGWHKVNTAFNTNYTLEEALNIIYNGLTFGFEFMVKNHELYYRDDTFY